MKKYLTVFFMALFAMNVFATEYTVSYQVNVTDPVSGSIYSIQSQGGAFQTGQSFTLGAATLPPALSNWQNLYDALVGSEIGIESGALNENIQIAINLMDFNPAIQGQYNNPDLFMFLGVTVIGDSSGYTPIDQFYHFVEGKKAYIKIPTSNSFNTLLTLLNINLSDIAFGYYINGLYTSDGLSFELSASHLTLNLTHFSKFGGGRGSIILGVEETLPVAPSSFDLFQNYPNPFNPTTKIRYSVTTAGLVTLKVYNMLGQEVRTLVSANKEAGVYEVNFEAANLPSGVYVYELKQNNMSLTKKMSLIK